MKMMILMMNLKLKICMIENLSQITLILFIKTVFSKQLNI